jgi:hypothetical protein
MAELTDRNGQLHALLTKLGQPRFDSQAAYMSFCTNAVNEYGATGSRSPETPTFARHLSNIGQGGEMVIKTPWGGVDIVKHEHPLVEKYLVVQASRFLAFEKHAEKVETLRVDEGVGVLVYRPEGASDLRAEALTAGYTRTLQPGQEHTIIALSNLLVYESSKDPKGMDKDLIFIYEPA